VIESSLGSASDLNFGASRAFTGHRGLRQRNDLRLRDLGREELGIGKRGFERGLGKHFLAQRIQQVRRDDGARRRRARG
jgi:hypothetical protein